MADGLGRVDFDLIRYFLLFFGKFLEDVWFKFAGWWYLWQQGFLRKRKEKQQKTNREMSGKGMRKGSGVTLGIKIRVRVLKIRFNTLT